MEDNITRRIEAMDMCQRLVAELIYYDVLVTNEMIRNIYDIVYQNKELKH